MSKVILPIIKKANLFTYRLNSKIMPHIKFRAQIKREYKSSNGQNKIEYKCEY